MGDYKLEFKRIFDYRDEILRSNPGSTCVVLTEIKSFPPKHVFNGIYVCLQAMKVGFNKGIRKCIGMDGFFLKGMCKGQLFSCVSKDGNSHMYPIAWAVFEGETKESLSWFIDLERDLLL
ncbi:hypothetical protein M5689_010701 [Euphorbia peplus]|nr:hypothetical protein M5689_010701 [Euphorbia peplus]